MQPRIELLSEKKLIGMSIKMSFAHNKTSDLWRSFMPRKKEIKNIVNTNLYSLQAYGKFFDFQNIQSEFEKWAAIEVTLYEDIPIGMKPFTLVRGLYAVFIHKGDESRAAQTFDYIFRTWLPSSGYELDDRPHFEILGDKYKRNDPESEEEVWIPIK